MIVMTALLNTVVPKCPRAQAPEKLPHSRLVGGAKALDPITVELALSDVKTMKTKGAIQTAATTISADPQHHEHRVDAVEAGLAGRLGQSRSLARLPLRSRPAQIRDDDRDGDQEQDDRDRRAAAEIAELHRLGEGPERQHLRRLRRARPASCRRRCRRPSAS